MWAIIILLFVDILVLGMHLAKHGEPRTDNYNFFTQLLGFVIVWWLLYEAGLFDKYLN